MLSALRLSSFLVVGFGVVAAGCGGGSGQTSGSGGSGAAGGSVAGSAGSGDGAAGAAGSDAGGGSGDAGADATMSCAAIAPRAVSDAPASANARGLTVAASTTGYGVAWSDGHDGNPEIYFARLDARGEGAGAVLRVTNATGSSVSPALIWTGTEYALVWHDNRDGNTEIYFARISEGGVKTGDDVRVTMDAARSEFPSLVWTSDGFGVVWNDTRDGTFQIYFARLGPTGTKMGNDARVSTGTALSASAVVTWSGSEYGVAWHDTRDGMGLQIYFARLGASGALVGTEKRLSDLTLHGGDASIAWSGAGYGVAWTGTSATGGEAALGRVGADGEPVGTGAPVTSTSLTASGARVTARPGGGWLLAWSDRRETDAEVHLRPFDATGAPAGADVQVTSDASPSLGAALAVSPAGGVAVAWTDAPSDTTGTPWFAAVCP